MRADPDLPVDRGGVRRRVARVERVVVLDVPAERVGGVTHVAEREGAGDVVHPVRERLALQQVVLHRPRAAAVVGERLEDLDAAAVLPLVVVERLQELGEAALVAERVADGASAAVDPLAADGRHQVLTCTSSETSKLLTRSNWSSSIASGIAWTRR